MSSTYKYALVCKSMSGSVFFPMGNLVGDYLWYNTINYPLVEGLFSHRHRCVQTKVYVTARTLSRNHWASNRGSPGATFTAAAGDKAALYMHTQKSVYCDCNLCLCVECCAQYLYQYLHQLVVARVQLGLAALLGAARPRLRVAPSLI